MAISFEKTAGRLDEWWKSSKRLPEVMGMSMSKRMTWAVKVVTCGTSADCGQRIEPMLKRSPASVSLSVAPAGQQRDRERNAREVDRVNRREVDGDVAAGDRPGNVLFVDLDACKKDRADGQRHSTRTQRRDNALRTKPLSSPGRTRRRSPTRTTPLQMRPATPTPLDVWPLNTFESGIRSGLSSARVGTSRPSARGVEQGQRTHSPDDNRGRPTNPGARRACRPCTKE